MITTDHTTPSDIPCGAVQAAVARARDAAWRSQREDGGWYSPAHLGPVSTARATLGLHFLGALDEDILLAARTVLLAAQLPDGSFPRHPLATEGDLDATAVSWAALRVTGLAEDAEPVRRSRACIDARGGLRRVADDVYRFDPEGIFIAMAGMLDPALLPEPPDELLVLPAIDELVTKRVNAYGLWMFPAVAAIVRYLRAGQRGGWLASEPAQRAIAIITQFQNDNGSFNVVVDQTALAAAALLSLGLPVEDRRIASAVQWMGLCLRHGSAPKTCFIMPGEEDPGLQFEAFPTNVWSTALMVRALLAGGVPRSDGRIARAVRWLLQAQIDDNPPALVPVPAGSTGTGGWAFGITNRTTPDCDDTAVVLAALGMALERSGADALDPAIAGLAREAAQKGLSWLLPMQNADGGWPAYQHGLACKPPGPILTEYQPIPRGIGLRDLVLLGAPFSWVVGDPATEDVTARTLFALAAHGYTIEAPEVARAVEFLKAQQCTVEHLGNAPEQGDGGAWWSRWICNYLAATAYAIGGLAAVGADLGAPWIRRAIDWIERHQNPDGGWGEEPRSYEDPRLAGVGESTPVLTGLVLTGILQAGEGSSPAVARGIDYLLREQRADGTWPNGQMLHVFFKVDTYYTFDAARLYYPLEALGRYLELRQGNALPVDRDGVGGGAASSQPARDAAGAWSDAFLGAARQVGDPEADAVIQEIFAEGEVNAVQAVLAGIIRSDEPVPAGLPPRVIEYFERTAELPAWADRERIALAERLFARCGYTGAIALFCSSLPQAYAAANGAKVLLGTGGMTRHVERRIFETAQFIFDVMDQGALSAKGRGVRAAQKVRLVHAAIRHLTLAQASWDHEAWGIPVNQEDLVGTLMTFSCVVLDAWKRLGLTLDADEAEAWLHAWNVVGHVLGVIPELLPRDVADGAALIDAIRHRQWAPSSEGRALAAALVAMMDGHLPRLGFARLPVTAMRYLAGDHCCDLLGLPSADWTRAVLHGLTLVEERVSHVDREAALRAALDRMAFELMNAIVLVERSGKQTRFRIPPALHHRWDLGD